MYQFVNQLVHRVTCVANGSDQPPVGMQTIDWSTKRKRNETNDRGNLRSGRKRPHVGVFTRRRFRFVSFRFDSFHFVRFVRLLICSP